MRANWTGRRQAERRAVSIKAQAQFYDGSPSLDCVITDYSPVGARIQFPSGQEPPGAFDLFVPSRGDTLHALLRWKTPDVIGVEFIQTRGTTGDQRLSEMLVRVSQIEEEMRALRADVALARGHAGEAQPSAASSDDADDEARHDLGRRVTTLEARNDEMLRALKQTLALLGELRTATAPIAKAG